MPLNAYVQQNQPPGVPPLELTGERTLPDVPAENYWFRRHLAVYEWIAARVVGRRVLDMACGEGYGSDVLARAAASVVGVDANPEAFEHARLRYRRPGLSFERGMVETFGSRPSSTRSCSCRRSSTSRTPSACSTHFRSLLRPGGVAFVSTPNVLTLAPPGAAKSDNPWHLKEYRASEFEELCRSVFGSVQLLGLFHARKLRVARAGAAMRLGRRPRPAGTSPSRSTTASRRRSRPATSRCGRPASSGRSTFSPSAGPERQFLPQ